MDLKSPRIKTEYEYFISTKYYYLVQLILKLIKEKKSLILTEQNLDQTMMKQVQYSSTLSHL